MTPIHLPFRARDRRAAMRPTRVRTESRTSLLRSASCCRAGGVHDNGWKQGVPYALVRNYAMVNQSALNTSQGSTYSSSSVCVNKPLRRRVLLHSFGDRVRHVDGCKRGCNWNCRRKGIRRRARTQQRGEQGRLKNSKRQSKRRAEV